MNPVEIGKGSSFKGLANYLLKGSRDAPEVDRAQWFASFNLMDADAERSWRLMVATAKSADTLKAAAGIAAGKKTTKPVYHYSLNFNPEDKAKATPELYRAAVESSLQALGLSDYQAVAVAHNDTGKPHVHVMVNLIDPATGFSAASKRGDQAALLSYSHTKLSKWAQGFIREHGLTMTEGRIANQTARANGQQIESQKRKPRHVYEHEKREGVDMRTAWLRKQHVDRRDTLMKEHADIRERQRTEWDALKESYRLEKDARRRARPAFKDIIADVKNEAKPEWAALFKKQRQELQEFQRGEKSTGRKLFNIAITLARLGRDGRGLRSLSTAFSAKEREAEFQRRQQADVMALREKVGERIGARLEAQKSSDNKAHEAGRDNYLARCAELRMAHDQEHVLMRDQWKNYNESRKQKTEKTLAMSASRDQDRGQSQDVGLGMRREP